jgi:lipase maturation factor 1
MLKVAAPPPKPLMIYDGDCNFCKCWIARWRKITGDALDYLPSQDPQSTKRFPEIPHEEFRKSVQFIESDGEVYFGAHAVFLSLAKNPKWQWPLCWYKKSYAFAGISETLYRFVAQHREFFSRLSGTHP